MSRVLFWAHLIFCIAKSSFMLNPLGEIVNYHARRDEMMSKRNWILTEWTIVGLVFLFTGCSRGRETIEISEIGFSMRLPAGWKSSGIERQDRREYALKADFYGPAKRDDNWGDISVLPLVIQQSLGGPVIEAQTLSEYVESQIKESEEMATIFRGMAKILEKMIPEQEKIEEQILPTRLRSKTTRTISSLEAIELITEATYTLMTVYIRKGDQVVVVSFRTLPEDFSEYEPSFQQAIESIKIK